METAFSIRGDDLRGPDRVRMRSGRRPDGYGASRVSASSTSVSILSSPSDWEAMIGP